MYTRQYFVERFRETDSEELLNRLATSDLTQEAKDAIRMILGERGVTDRDAAVLVQEAKRANYRRTSPTRECDFCGKSSGFFPVRDEGQKFCSQTCLRNARLMEVAVDIPEQQILDRAIEIKNGSCPLCKGRASKIEVRKFYWVWSALFFTRWGTSAKVCCAKCGVRAKLMAIASSTFLGWWGFPWGLFVTPVQIMSNVVALFARIDKSKPSEELVQAAKLQLAEALLARKPSTAPEAIAIQVTLGKATRS